MCWAGRYCAAWLLKDVGYRRDLMEVLFWAYPGGQSSGPPSEVMGLLCFMEEYWIFSWVEDSVLDQRCLEFGPILT